MQYKQNKSPTLLVYGS